MGKKLKQNKKTANNLTNGRKLKLMRRKFSPFFFSHNWNEEKIVERK